jgi:UDP-N-acetyl-D-galactosamine dehydrogenase
MLDSSRNTSSAELTTSLPARCRLDFDRAVIGVLGLGYVGLPLAVEFGKVRPVVGFDVNNGRVEALARGVSQTGELHENELKSARHLRFTANPHDLKHCKIFIVSVPTPIDRVKRPDLRPLQTASETVGRVLTPDAIVVYESTVYPGCTEEFCVPILEKTSGLRLNRDFFVGYSPERINPGDPKHALTEICKVTSGSTQEVADAIDRLYASIIKAGTHKASSIRVAEAAKVIENTQRDLNIALVNELSLIFHKLGIDTHEVLDAAGTKWNFLPFRPGLVGGHCIGVDPYYLTHKAQEIGYHPEVILAGRRINDSMGRFVAQEVVKLASQKRLPVAGGRAIVLGLAFKENCSDLRNSKVADVIDTLQQYAMDVDVYDPWVDVQLAAEEFDVNCLDCLPENGNYDAIIVAVAHNMFKELGATMIRRVGKPGAVLYDVKGIFKRSDVDGRL